MPAALLSLFQVITPDNWSDTYRAARAGAPVAAPIYFVSFILLGTFIMLNLLRKAEDLLTGLGQGQALSAAARVTVLE